jgi:hypothetical protein
MGATCGAGTAYPRKAPKFVSIFLLVFLVLVPCCDVLCDFRVKTMFDSSRI